MKTTAILASPRRHGNCDIIIDKILEKINGEKEKYFLKKLDIGFCNACQVCKDGDCVKDDDAQVIINSMLESDLIIFATPIYYGQMSGHAKTMIDRFYQVTMNPEKSFEGKKVILVVTQANPGDTYDDYINSMHVMPFGFMGMEVTETLIARGAMDKGEGIEEVLEKIESMEI